jgi:homeobox protein cut-like
MSINLATRLPCQVLHAELEASFRSVSEDLATCRADLERQKVLNDRLENDLLHVDQHMGRVNADRLSGTSTPDPLTSLNIGTSVSSELVSLSASL